jgi:hypothetical protein
MRDYSALVLVLIGVAIVALSPLIQNLWIRHSETDTAPFAKERRQFFRSPYALWILRLFGVIFSIAGIIAVLIS